MNDIHRDGGRAFAVPHDATAPMQVAEAVEKVRNHFGSIATLIYNAGNFVRGNLAEVTPAELEGALRIGHPRSSCHFR